jgi:hypothetical protein
MSTFQITHKLQVERPLQVAVEVIRRDEILEGDGRKHGKESVLLSPS